MARAVWRRQVLTTREVNSLVTRFRGLMNYLQLGSWQSGTTKGTSIEAGTGRQTVLTAVKKGKKWVVRSAFLLA